MELTVGQTHAVKVRARRTWTDTEIDVEAGQRYRFEARGRWSDLFYRSGPEGNPKPNRAMRRHAARLRVPTARYMALVAAVDRDLSAPIVFEGAGKAWTAERAGRLACFANDVPGFYWNNWGALDLVIERVA